MPSIRNIANMCSHLQNASKAKLGITSIPSNKFNLHLALALHRSGFCSSVYRGGPQPPTQEQMTTEVAEPVTHSNVATRRIWLGLKYWEGKPVLSKLKVLSKPSRLLTADVHALERLTRGLPAKMDGGNLKGLGMGECLYLSTSLGVLEAREAVEKKTGGLLMCRVS